jgi:peptidoglycan/xylan/chitin deacetylase (PgdA/CDA1 family)
MSARSTAAAGVTRLLGTRAFEAAGVAATKHKVRVLAYHGVDDPTAFEAQVRHLSSRYRLVSGAQVADALASGVPLPDRSAWITFDDGDPSVVTNALPVLAAAKAPATVFVCPALIDAGSPPWWRVVEAAGARGIGSDVDGQRLEGRPLVRALKRVPDQVRRDVIVELVAADPQVASAGPADGGPPALSVADLHRWTEAGLELGNHTWDHPCLDHCDPTDQRAQLVLAHEWLVRHLGRHPRLFAYPNGDHTSDAEAVLAELGYEVGLLFDHALGDLAQPPLRLSRLRLDSEAPVWRARAVLSGAHGALLGAVS